VKEVKPNAKIGFKDVFSNLVTNDAEEMEKA
jgi:hypothetical protein